MIRRAWPQQVRPAARGLIATYSDFAVGIAEERDVAVQERDVAVQERDAAVQERGVHHAVVVGLDVGDLVVADALEVVVERVGGDEARARRACFVVRRRSRPRGCVI